MVSPHPKGNAPGSRKLRLSALKPAAQSQALALGIPDADARFTWLTPDHYATVLAATVASAPDWPIWALVAALFATPKDAGIGDTISRELGGAKTEAFKRHHETVFGVWSKPCACAGQVAAWNALYPY